MEQRIVNEYGASYTKLSSEFQMIQERYFKEVRYFIENNNLNPIEIHLLESIANQSCVFAEERLRLAMKIRKAERADCGIHKLNKSIPDTSGEGNRLDN